MDSNRPWRFSPLRGALRASKTLPRFDSHHPWCSPSLCSGRGPNRQSCRFVSNWALFPIPLLVTKKRALWAPFLLLAERGGWIRIALGDSHPCGAHYVRPKRSRVLSNWALFPIPLLVTKKGPCGPLFYYWRRGGDSNPRYGITVHSLSRRAP